MKKKKVRKLFHPEFISYLTLEITTTTKRNQTKGEIQNNNAHCDVTSSEQLYIKENAKIQEQRGNT